MAKKNRKKLFSLTAKDFEIDYYRGSGAGGQHRNKTDSCVRIKHPESGAVAQCCDHRSQHRNKGLALKRLIKTAAFRKWHRRKIAELQGRIKTEEELMAEVDELMDPKYIKIEYAEKF